MHAPVAQLDRALASGAKGQRFESSRARHFKRTFISVDTGFLRVQYFWFGALATELGEPSLPS